MISRDKVNDRAEVMEWQVFLNSFEGEHLTTDGTYGPNTGAATIRFQSKYALKPDGIVGPGTWSKAKSIQAEKMGTINQNPSVLDRAKRNDSLDSQPVVSKVYAKRILISAGHSTIAPKDPGAVGCGYVEANETLRMRDAVAMCLRQMGFTNVIEDGIDGINDPLTKAISLARGTDFAVEFHLNSGPNGATGVEVLSGLKWKKMSQTIALSIREATGLSVRGSEYGWKGEASGAHHRLGFIEAGGIIVETCFISNCNDMKRYNDSFQVIAAVIADDIFKGLNF